MREGFVHKTIGDMMKYICLAALFLSTPMPLMLLHSQEGSGCKRCEHQRSQDSDCCERETPEGYDPYRRYYPYNSIYQDSKVRDVSSDDDESYWPSKRDDDFIDALMR